MADVPSRTADGNLPSRSDIVERAGRDRRRVVVKPFPEGEFEMDGGPEAPSDELPEATNFYAMLHTSLPPRDVAELYRAHGWMVRKCGWNEFELQTSWCCLVVEGSSPVLMHGLVADVMRRVDSLLKPARSVDIEVEAECLDATGETTLRVKTLAQDVRGSSGDREQG